MPTAKRLAQQLYRTFVPASVRESAVVGTLKNSLLGHGWIYDADFFEREVEGPAVRSAGRIADSFVREFGPVRVMDVGCGTGALLEALRDRGCEVSGLEYAEAALAYCRARNLEVAKFDLEQNRFDDSGTFDAAISMEVAEHLPESAADRYVALLARLAPLVVFTAATPGQGGTDHVNEQPHAYWIEKFRGHGFSHAEDMSRRWREEWQASGEVQSWYSANLMIFQRPPRAERGD